MYVSSNVYSFNALMSCWIKKFYFLAVKYPASKSYVSSSEVYDWCYEYVIGEGSVQRYKAKKKTKKKLSVKGGRQGENFVFLTLG